MRVADQAVVFATPDYVAANNVAKVLSDPDVGLPERSTLVLNNLRLEGAGDMETPMSTDPMPGTSGPPPPMPSDPRARQEQIMRWLAFAAVLGIIVGLLAIITIHGPSISAIALCASMISLFAWLVRRLFGPWP